MKLRSIRRLALKLAYNSKVGKSEGDREIIDRAREWEREGERER